MYGQIFTTLVTFLVLDLFVFVTLFVLSGTFLLGIEQYVVLRADSDS